MNIRVSRIQLHTLKKRKEKQPRKDRTLQFSNLYNILGSRAVSRELPARKSRAELPPSTASPQLAEPSRTTLMMTTEIHHLDQ